MKTIPLTQGKFAMVDDEDFERLSAFKWNARKRAWNARTWFYAVRSGSSVDGKRTWILMHREITLAGKGLDVDHRDSDGLNNLRSNLRVATRTQNQHNRRKQTTVTTSQFKGVHWHSRRWVACIRVAGKLIHLGRFTSEREAASVYDDAALKHFGEFARINFPSERQAA